MDADQEVASHLWQVPVDRLGHFLLLPRRVRQLKRDHLLVTRISSLAGSQSSQTRKSTPYRSHSWTTRLVEYSRVRLMPTVSTPLDVVLIIPHSSPTVFDLR